MNPSPITFSAHPYIKNVAAGIDFYQKAFGAVELRRWSNSDGSVHVVEMTIGGAMFHVHEESPHSNELSPESLKGTTTSLIGVFTEDPDTFYHSAIAAGGTIVSEIQDYDYGFRQGVVADPFGHQWLLQKKI